MLRRKEVTVCLDSGAFTIYQKCKKLGASEDYYKTEIYEEYLEAYLDYIEKNERLLSFYINLDVIHNAKATYEIQQQIESYGFSPVPVFHIGEDLAYLRKYMDNHSYIALGGTAKGVNKKDITKHMDIVFAYAKGQDIKFHGLGVSDAFLLKRYNWYSVDSSSLMQPAIYGGIFFPQMTLQGNYDFLGRIRYVRFSDKSSDAKDYYKRFPSQDLKKIMQYLELLQASPSRLGEELNERIRCNAYYFNRRLLALQEYNKEQGRFPLKELYIAGCWGMPRERLCTYTQHLNKLAWLVSFANVKHSDRILSIKQSFETKRRLRGSK